MCSPEALLSSPPAALLKRFVEIMPRYDTECSGPGCDARAEVVVDVNATSFLSEIKTAGTRGIVIGK